MEPRVHMLPRWLRGKEPACQSRGRGLHPRVWKILRKRKWQPTPSILAQKNPMDREAWRDTTKTGLESYVKK